MATPANLSTLSPREQFQNSVRQLSNEDVHRHRRNKSIHLKYNPYEPQHVSSLRVSPLRKSPYRADSTILRQVTEEPDFGSEEASIWSRSPVSKAKSTPAKSFILHEDEPASPSENRGHRAQLPPLKPQILVHADYDERPKTRRGPSGPSAFGKEADSESEDEALPTLATAKFSEGTMTSRSGAVASSWSDSEYATSSSEAEETDSEATPKATRKRRSGSFDLRDFQPPALTPSAIKRTLFGKREGKKEKTTAKTTKTTKPVQEEHDEAKKPRKRLRKSMSKLQFLGEKMKIFGSSSQDLPEQAAHNNPPKAHDDKAILDERKRKAETAYAEQFGSKKQRDNDGLANVTSSPEPPPPDMRGNQKYDSSTVRCRTTSARSRRVSTGSMLFEDGLGQSGSTNEHDIRKRPSRRELEKENQQLREMLKESQAARDQASAYNSEPESIPPVPPLRIRRSYVVSSAVPPSTNVPPMAAGDVVESAPPVPPQHPDRRVLGNVSNNRYRRIRRETLDVPADSVEKERTVAKVDANPLENPPKLVPTPLEKPSTVQPRRAGPMLPTSVSMIIEEPEDDGEDNKKSFRARAQAAGKENMALIATIGVGGRNEEWQWPDDVF